jgi:hypothetical protein
MGQLPYPAARQGRQPPRERGPMSKKTKDSKRTRVVKAAIKTQVKPHGRGENVSVHAKVIPPKGPIIKDKIGLPLESDPGSAGLPKRKLGLRGAAPWAARHAAKHAAEARARAAEPPPPGSARATIRAPLGAEELKDKIGQLHNALLQVRAYRKNLNKSFYDIGVVLRDIQQRKLYEAKGYGSFEAFLEREIDLGKTLALKLVRVSVMFIKEAAVEIGMDRLLQAIQVLELTNDSAPKNSASPGSAPPAAPKLALPLKPPLGRVG